MLRGVLDETDDGERLFLASELALVSNFRQSLTLDAKKLYVRLFQRKFDWIQSIKYDEIFDVQDAITCLLKHDFLIDGEGSFFHFKDFAQNRLRVFTYYFFRNQLRRHRKSAESCVCSQLEKAM